VVRSGLRVRNLCATHPVGRMSDLTEKVKTEIPVHSCASPDETMSALEAVGHQSRSKLRAGILARKR
jgi:hypothetical protein